MHPPDGIFPVKINAYMHRAAPGFVSFITFFLPNRQIRIFSFMTGKLTRKCDGSLAKRCSRPE